MVGHKSTLIQRVNGVRKVMGSIFRFYSLGLGVLIVGLTLSGCAGEDPATDAIVTIDATDTVAAEIESLVIRVQGAPNALAPLEPPYRTYFYKRIRHLIPARGSDCTL
ncbi:MAG: hypothetical protein AAF550_05590 [Myxococcota bacterium]